MLALCGLGLATLLVAPAGVAERPGGRVVLTRANPVGRGSGTLNAPGQDKQDYTVFELDCRDFAGGGTLVIQVTLGDGASAGSFDLFPQGVPIPSSGGPAGTLGGAYDVKPGGQAEITHRFKAGEVFRFGATGNWFSEVGTTNSFSFLATVKDYPPEPAPTSGGSSKVIVLTRTNPHGAGQGTLVAPGEGFQSHNVFLVDTRDFARGAIITFKIKLGAGESDGSFDLFPEGAPIPTEGGPAGTLAGAYDVKKGEDAKIDFQIERPQVFQLNATGNWYSPKGATNSFSFTVDVTP